MTAKEFKERFSRLTRMDADEWLDTDNVMFGCKPRLLLGTDREEEIELMLFRMNAGMPF